MGKNSGIEWTHHSWSPWIGCTKVSQGCKHCYAEELMTRKGRWANTWGPQGERVRTSEAYWRKPLAWNRQAEKEGVRYRVFPSLCDPFDEHHSIPQGWRNEFFELIEATPHLDWLLLTKRPEWERGLAPVGWWDGYPPNVWVGVSVEDQATAEERIPALMTIPARVRFLSCEPLLGRIDFALDTWQVGKPFRPGWLKTEHSPNGVNWVIVGGESGSQARPMLLEWARHIVWQCQLANVPVFVKQLGARPGLALNGEPLVRSLSLKDRKGGDWGEWPVDLRIREFPNGERDG